MAFNYASATYPEDEMTRVEKLVLGAIVAVPAMLLIATVIYAFLWFAGVI